jgi:hypothetical protein
MNTQDKAIAELSKWLQENRSYRKAEAESTAFGFVRSGWDGDPATDFIDLWIESEKQAKTEC